jgi:hypothetical protein
LSCRFSVTDCSSSSSMKSVSIAKCVATNYVRDCEFEWRHLLTAFGAIIIGYALYRAYVCTSSKWTWRARVKITVVAKTSLRAKLRRLEYQRLEQPTSPAHFCFTQLKAPTSRSLFLLHTICRENPSLFSVYLSVN